ncbi:hypothetical protein GCM10010435_67770 [Winogradskya consettensis]|uniref:Uncharacterized protein n=1 Tax=Winogradskya consettensis TaxID=113560 RepID=A0A919SMQ2_9ACTN|nr:adenylyl-sulfate kinase [Actinoplanes consettensis]GIM73763.1 hypothetical protein Aco04nite_37000 [Actinoplanes consettensis]
MTQIVPPEVLLIAGRAGAGKTTVGWEISAQLQAAGIAHCLVEGDNLDQAYPAPPGDPTRRKLTESNLTAIWHNYAALGYRRLVYTNTVSVLEADMISRAVGGTPRITAALLTADDSTARGRLQAREIGTQLDAHLIRGAEMSRRLEASAPSWVVRVRTDGRAVAEVAAGVIVVAQWSSGPRLRGLPR